MGKYLHVEFMDGEVEHQSVQYGDVVDADGVLRYVEKNNARELPKLKRAWPLHNVRRYWLNDWEDR